MIGIGVIGIGTMGTTHLDVYARRTHDVRVVALADPLPERRSGASRARGNIEGQAQGGFDHASARQYDDGMALLADPDVQAVDICVPTPLHQRFALATLAAGKHVLVEKPVCRTAAEADVLAEAAERAWATSGAIAMCAKCMRFWPAWAWLKEAIDASTYGKVLSATFRRVASHPGGAFYSDGDACGGAALDLHIHDSDFVQFCFGTPRSVCSVGHRSVTNATDHIFTQYHYGGDGPIVVAEGGWAMSPGFGFRMQYTVNFQRATAQFDISAADQLLLYEPGQSPRSVTVPQGAGYDHEIDYFLGCIKEGRRPQRVTIRDAARAVAIVEAEVRSIASGRAEPVV